MPNYHDEMRDPRWQRKRLQILSDADFTCEECRNQEKELNVHHSAYLRGIPAWQHPDSLLHCLCRDCHKQRQEVEESLKLEMMKRLRRVPLERIKQIFWEVMAQAMKEPQT